MRSAITIRTLSTSSDDQEPCYDRKTCPGVHEVAERPGQHYCIVTVVTDPDAIASAAPTPTQLLGTIPAPIIDRLTGGSPVAGLSRRAGLYYLVVTEVVDPAELAAFTTLIGPGEALGTMPSTVLGDRRLGSSW